MHRHHAIALAKQTRAVVVSVGDRLVQAHKFPAAWYDAFAAYKWVPINAASINTTLRDWRLLARVLSAIWRSPLR